MQRNRSQGNSIEGAINNLKEATELYLEEFLTIKHSHPLLTTFELLKLHNLKKIY